LGGLHEKLHLPRKKEPRTQIIAGSVGIGGNQTGIYPLNSPGGWNLIGRTPISLFSKNIQPPALFKAGDRIQFQSIDKDEFARISEAIQKKAYDIEQEAWND
jgi:KipI family sensor histidine kinase inhibitor